MGVEQNDASMTMRTLKQRDKGSIKMSLKRREPIIARKPVLAKKIYRMSSKFKTPVQNEYNTNQDEIEDIEGKTNE